MNFSESAIYRHFKNKEEIIVTMLELLFHNMQIRLNAVFDEKKSSEENLKNVFNSQFIFFNENQHYLVAILSEGLLDESDLIFNNMMKIIALKSSIITKIIELGKERGELKNEIDTEDMVHIITGSFRLMMLKWKFSQFKFDIVSKGNQIIQTIYQLIQK